MPAQDGMSVVATGLLPRDLSSWGMFLDADVIVQAVMIGLVFASVVTWTVLLAKSVELARAARRQRRAHGVIAEAGSLSEAAGTLLPESSLGAALVEAASDELRQSADALPDPRSTEPR